jgi:hypothetical protein
MKRFLVGIIAATVAIGFGTMTVSASTGAATPFKVQYLATDTSTWTCAGAHIVNKAGIKDSETCAVTGDTSPYIAGTFTSGEICPSNDQYYPRSIQGTPACGELPPYSAPGLPAWWLSDFNAHPATSWTVVMTMNRDGTFKAAIVAHYGS